MDKITLNIAEEFSKIPGVRELVEGDFPGERFLNDLLLPRFELAIKEKKKLEIDLNGAAGFTTSFLESAFGGLTRIYKDKSLILNNIIFISNEDPFLVDDIKEYIRDAQSK
jgi:hypothetical protein